MYNLITNSKIFISIVVRLWSTMKGGDNDHLITRLRKSAEFDHISNCNTNYRIFVFFVIGFVGIYPQKHYTK